MGDSIGQGSLFFDDHISGFVHPDDGQPGAIENRSGLDCHSGQRYRRPNDGRYIVLYKLLAFFVAGFLGGIAGAFWISSLAAVSPEHFHFGWSLWIVGVILIGGAGNLYGTIFGAMFMTLIPEALKALIFLLTQNPLLVNLMPFLPHLLEKFLFVKEAVFGLAIALFLIFEPKGLSYRWWQIKNYFNLWPFSY
jgi:branched-chain amino acid transport system permease protein